MELTKKEKKLFEFIEVYQLEHGASPTVKEMRRHMGLKSDGFVVHCLKALATKGFIEKGVTPRSIKLLPKAAEKLHSNMIKIPVLGRVPAGGAVLAQEYAEDWMAFEEGKIKHPQETFILKVAGDSMIDTGIHDGDFVIASGKLQPKQGNIVVALIDGGSTVKRYMKSNGTVYLKPENVKYKNIYPESDLQIQGVVIGMFRWY